MIITLDFFSCQSVCVELKFPFDSSFAFNCKTVLHLHLKQIRWHFNYLVSFELFFKFYLRSLISLSIYFLRRKKLRCAFFIEFFYLKFQYLWNRSEFQPLNTVKLTECRLNLLNIFWLIKAEILCYFRKSN